MPFCDTFRAYKRWCIDSLRDLRDRLALAIGTSHQHLDAYRSLVAEVERRLRLYRLIDHLRGRRADVILTNAESNPRAVAELKRLHWGVALGDDYSATKSFVSMTLLKGRRVTLLPDLEVAQIFGLVVRDGKADVGVVARSFVESQPCDELNPTRAEEGGRVIARGLPQPALVVALSPKLDDGDRRVLARLLMDLPAQVRTRIRPANTRV